MNKNKFVLNNFSKYLEEISAKYEVIKKSHEMSCDDLNAYSMDASIFVDRLDLLVKEMEDSLQLNEIRAFNYAYTLKYDTSIDEILMPANNAGSIIKSISNTIKAISPDSKLILRNILRGSTVFCFDYEQTQRSTENVDIDKKLNDFNLALSLQDSEVRKEVTGVFRNDMIEKKVIKSFKSMMPALGSETKVFIQTEIKDHKPIALDGELKGKIDRIYPSKRNKDERVDWDNFLAKGYIREINDVSRSFILYENLSEESLESGMIKIYYSDKSFKDYLLKQFRKKITVSFEKEGKKYMLNEIK